jgi:predicted transcriptional regulator
LSFGEQLDVPDYFLDPQRMQAGLVWFGRGYVEYKFPNNARVLNKDIGARVLFGTFVGSPGHQLRLTF